MEVAENMERLDMLKRMMVIREFERIIKELARTKVVDGAIHCYTGEEAVAVGVCAGLVLLYHVPALLRLSQGKEERLSFEQDITYKFDERF